MLKLDTSLCKTSGTMNTIWMNDFLQTVFCKSQNTLMVIVASQMSTISQVWPIIFQLPVSLANHS